MEVQSILLKMNDFLCDTVIIVIFGVLIPAYSSTIESPEPVSTNIVLNKIRSENVEAEPSSEF